MHLFRDVHCTVSTFEGTCSADCSLRSHFIQMLNMKFLIVCLLCAGSVIAVAQNADSVLQEGIKQHNQKDYRRAVALYTQAIGLGHDIYVAYYNRSVCYIQLKEIDSALFDVRKALFLQPNDTSALYVLATAYAHLEKYDSALVTLNTLLVIKEAYPNAQTLRGQLYLAKQDVAKACEDFGKAAKRGDAMATDLKRKYCDGLDENLVIALPEADGWKEASVQDAENVTMSTYTRSGETLTNWTQLYGSMKVLGSFPSAQTLMDIFIEQARKVSSKVKLTEIERDPADPPKWVIYITETPKHDDSLYAECNIWCIRVGEIATFASHLDVRSEKLNPELVKKWVAVFKKSSIKSSN